MKRIILFFTLVLMASTLLAQTSAQINFRSLQKKLEKSNSEIEHPKKKLNYSTWQKRGDLMIEIYESMLLRAPVGLGMNEFAIVVGQPKQRVEEVIDNQNYVIFEMERVNFYFSNGVLEYWKFTNNLFENSLEEAYRSFMKASELDVKGKGTKKIGESMTKLKYHFVSEGTNCYTKKEYSCSHSSFANAVKVGETPIVNALDTIVVYYAGLSAQIGQDYENAIKYYEKSLDYKFYSEGNVFSNLFDCYSQIGKDAEGLKYLEQGFLRFPKNEPILYSLINYYINKGEDPNIVLELIQRAMETQPNDFSLYFAQGFLFDKLQNHVAAEKSYKRALEIKPDFFDAMFNLGAIYFNDGVKYLEEANKVPAREIDRYDALIAKSNDSFRKSIPYMENSYKLDPNNKGVIETLRNLYFRFRNDGEEMQKKYDDIHKVWNELK
jgi:tetratricopeptide (TPR) repeat protein